VQTTFDQLIESYLINQVGITENFIDDILSAQLKQNLLILFEENQLHSAGVGNSAVILQDKMIRSDMIHWLDRSHDNQFENSFLDIIDKFIIHLNETCYTGIKSYEFHYTLYPVGAFYKKHIDQFNNNGQRAFSMIVYLNTNWKIADGGELRIEQAEQSQNISPNNGKCVFFKSSELLHEVLVTNEPRLSITGWLKTI